MTDANHEKRLKKVETEILELRKQILQLEFISRRDHAIAQREFDSNDKKIQKRIDYIAKLAGITMDELNLLDEKIKTSGRVLAEPRRHSSLS